MKNRYLLSCLLLVLGALAATLLVYHRLPAQVPMHWNAAGEVDSWKPRVWIFTEVGMMALILALSAVLPRISPRNFAVDSFRATWWQVSLMVVAMLAYVQGVLLWTILSHELRLDRAIMGGVAVLVALLGNVMGKVRRNFWLGVRTPWTLASERVWYATHRLAAKWMVGAGLLALAAVIAGLPVQAALGLIMAGVLVPAAWSLVYYKRIEGGERQA